MVVSFRLIELQAPLYNWEVRRKTPIKWKQIHSPSQVVIKILWQYFYFSGASVDSGFKRASAVPWVVFCHWYNGCEVKTGLSGLAWEDRTLLAWIVFCVYIDFYFLVKSYEPVNYWQKYKYAIMKVIQPVKHSRRWLSGCQGAHLNKWRDRVFAIR